MRNTKRFFLRAAALLLTLAPVLALAQFCTGLCLQQVACPSGGTTSVSGMVFAPNGTDPLPGVLVYIPNGPVQALPAGATCRQGGTPPSSPLVQAITGVDGKFTLTNMPVGTSIPLIIQAGKWRRQMTIPNVPACVNTPLPSAGASQLRFPQNHTEGDMPNLAVVTGSGDVQECILRKIGIADTEFTPSSGTGRVKLFSGAGSAGASLPGIVSETVLEASSATLGNYDMVMFACQAGEYAQTPAAQQRVINYADLGGRVMATHYAYTWLYNVAPFSGTAAWATNGTNGFAADPQMGYINTISPDGLRLAQWLKLLDPSSNLGQVPLADLRHDFNGAISPSLVWFNVNDSFLGNVPMQYTFDTPVGATPANQCGRVQFNDYHPETPSSGSSSGTTFPQECTIGGMTPQEKVFEYMLFDLTNNTESGMGLTIDNGRQFARYGHVANYTANLFNYAATSANVAVTSTLSTGLDAANALCIGGGGATCTTSAAGGLTASANLGGNSIATWVISVPVLASTSDTTVEMDVSTPGVAVAKDVRTLVIFRDGYDVENGDGTL